MSDTWLVDGPAGGVMLISATAYTLRPTDNNLTLVFTKDTDITVTVPSRTLPRGWRATIVQFGAGIVSLVAQSGMTLYNILSQFATAGPYGVLYLNAPRQDQIVVSGDGVGGTIVSGITIHDTTLLSANFWGDVWVDNTTAGAIIVTLPPDPASGQRVLVKDATGNAGTYTITVEGDGGDLIEGVASMDLTIDYSWLDLVFTGVQWVQT